MMSSAVVCVLTLVFMLAILIVDRFVLERGKCHLVGVRRARMHDSDGTLTLICEFELGSIPKWGKLKIAIRDKEEPTRIVEAKTRNLRIATRGGTNVEYVMVEPEKQIEGRWIAEAHLVSVTCRINPLYKIFPFESRIQKEIDFNI